jgi:hypothetical protein
MFKRKIQTDLKRKIWNCKKEHVKKQTNVKSKQRNINTERQRENKRKKHTVTAQVKSSQMMER